MATLFRWLAPVALAAGLGVGALAPMPAHAQNDALAMTRQIVDLADVVINGGVPYYRYGHYGRYDRLVVEPDDYGRPVYYRYVPRAPRVVYYAPPRVVYRDYYTAPRGYAYGYWRHHDRDGDDRRYGDRDWDDHRWYGDRDWDDRRRHGDGDRDDRRWHHGDHDGWHRRHHDDD